MNEFKVGQKVVCVSSEFNRITKGKRYTIQSKSKVLVWVVTDCGGNGAYRYIHFHPCNNLEERTR